MDIHDTMSENAVAYTTDELEKLTYRELQCIAKPLKLPSNVKKIYLIQLINAHYNESQEQVDSILAMIKKERKKTNVKKQRKRRLWSYQNSEVSSTSESCMSNGHSNYIRYHPTSESTPIRRSCGWDTRSKSPKRPITRILRKRNYSSYDVADKKRNERSYGLQKDEHLKLALQNTNSIRRWTTNESSKKPNSIKCHQNPSKIITTSSKFYMAGKYKTVPITLHSGNEVIQVLGRTPCNVSYGQTTSTCVDRSGNVHKANLNSLNNMGLAQTATHSEEYEKTTQSNMVTYSHKTLSNTASSLNVQQYTYSLVNDGQPSLDPVHNTIDYLQQEQLNESYQNNVYIDMDNLQQTGRVYSYNGQIFNNNDVAYSNNEVVNNVYVNQGNFVSLPQTEHTMYTYNEVVHNCEHESQTTRIPLTFCAANNVVSEGGVEREYVHKKKRAARHHRSISVPGKLLNLSTLIKRNPTKIHEVLSEFNESRVQVYGEPKRAASVPNHSSTYYMQEFFQDANTNTSETFYDNKGDLTQSTILQVVPSTNYYQSSTYDQESNEPSQIASTSVVETTTIEQTRFHDGENELSYPLIHQYVKSAEKEVMSYQQNVSFESPETCSTPLYVPASPAKNNESCYEVLYPSDAYLGATVTVSGLDLEDALEVISQQGDYQSQYDSLEEITDDDTAMECILCHWVGAKCALESHLREEHTSEILSYNSSEWKVVFSLGTLIKQNGWIYKVLESGKGRLYILSVKYVEDILLAGVSKPTTEDHFEESEKASITIYNKLTGQPFTWEGTIDITQNLLLEIGDSLLEVELSKLDVLPNSANVILEDGQFVSKSYHQVVCGPSLMDEISIVIYVKI